MQRLDNRSTEQLRNYEFITNFQVNPTGSVLVSFGNTRVICAVTVSKGVPSWKREQKIESGWLTAEYQMLPGATTKRNKREIIKANGRNTEIKRLIGRSLRAIIDLNKIPNLTINVDCDVLDADGGTRCASITGAAVALEIACNKLIEQGIIQQSPIKERLAAISVGIVNNTPILDLCYQEDSKAEVDMNIVMTQSEKFIEIQGTAEAEPFSKKQMEQMLQLAQQGITQILTTIDKIFTK